MIKKDDNGRVVLDQGTGLSISMVVLLIGGAFGFFSAWAIPGIRMQEDIQNHIQYDEREMGDYETRLRLLESFKSEGGRWSIKQQTAYVEGHRAAHTAERTELLEAIQKVQITQAETNIRLKALEKKR